MAAPIKYSKLYLYTTDNESSVTVRSFLDSFRIKFVNLHYEDDVAEQACLDALNTWFDKPNAPGEKITFIKFPILVYDKVFWESPDGSDVYAKRSFAVTKNQLPPDFLSKTEKVKPD